ncbi:chloroplast ribosome releasing factor RRF [Klebsormidium nitens]|uniref:Ribosome-recycling factor, chloroplastic n=1 Tax=Klebsormidium nitens TaxID=105231 RepID=A0A1Y1HSH6_KLENI|nr:chloroplast ribosome releasing factor RRF [Klebsormidium nitens]|eukprot:GAQ79516.1 chloroplast ribosome releasing factor RRF [Klebsormidium nitens]
MASALHCATNAGGTIALAGSWKRTRATVNTLPLVVKASSSPRPQLPAPAFATPHPVSSKLGQALWLRKHVGHHDSSGLDRSRDSQVCKATEEISTMCEEIELETEEKMEKCIESVRAKFNSVRTGRASTSLLDRVEVDYYGVPVILKSLANISTPDASSILIQPFDKSSITAISKALLQSDLGLTPTNDGTVIRLNIPPLTGDRRKELVKTIGKLAEDGRIAIRNVRRDAIKKFEKMEKDGELSEDNLRDYEDTVQKMTDKYVKKVDELYKAKEKDILQV